MATTWLEKGMERGLVAGQRKTILVVLENRFGPLDESVIARVNDWPAGQLDELTKNILTANSLKDLGLQD